MCKPCVLRFSLLLLLTVPPMLDAGDRRPSAYPPSRTDKVVEKLHGIEITDPYRWLEDADSPDVKNWVDAQNAYSRSVLDSLPGRDRIHRRLSDLLDIGTISTPAPVKGR